MTVAAVEFKNISKTFGPIKANSNISFQVAAGHIHAIVGENGAGKSTAMKILFGLYEPTDGQVLLHGSAVSFKSPIEAMKKRIGMVHQHFMLAAPVTALDNILLQHAGSAFSLLPRQEQKGRLEGIAQRYGLNIPLESKVEDLSVGEQQRLEILKVLAQDSEILILDEPTAVLTPQEVEDLFRNLRLLKQEGKTILIITHKLKEVMTISDEITIFRAGTVVGNKKTSETNCEELAELMIGHRPQKASERSTTIDQDKVVLSLSEVSAQIGHHQVRNINLQVHSKEIVGIAGVEGNGQDVLIRTLLDKHALQKGSLKGQIKLTGMLQSFPEDRLRFGALPTRPAYENLLLGHQRDPSFVRGIFLKTKDLIRKTQELMNFYDVRPADPNITFGKLSGGNQQKLVVARALFCNPEVLIAAQPTRGVDIGAVDFIHKQLREQRDRGAGILLISSELDELMTLSDRIHVIYKGQLIAQFARHEFNEIALGKAMGGGL